MPRMNNDLIISAEETDFGDMAFLTASILNSLSNNLKRFLNDLCICSFFGDKFRGSSILPSGRLEG